MAITRNDCLLLLTELKNNGIDTSNQVKELLKTNEVSLEVLEFINQNRQLELSQFYDYIRKNYNKKKSKLYINIVKENYDDPKNVLTTLAALNLQILLYCKYIQTDVDMFLRHARFTEVNQCLLNYANTKDLISCQKLLRRIKSDIKCLEMFNKKQNS